MITAVVSTCTTFCTDRYFLYACSALVRIMTGETGADALRQGAAPRMRPGYWQIYRGSTLPALLLVTSLALVLHGEAVESAEAAGAAPSRPRLHLRGAAPCAGERGGVLLRGYGAICHGNRGCAGAGEGAGAGASVLLRLRGGKGSAKTRSGSVTRSKSPEGKRSTSLQNPKLKIGGRAVKAKKKQKPHNLGPAEWMKKLKRPEQQRREVSMKGCAKGRKKPVFHFWTHSKIKKFTEKRVAFRAKRRERKEKAQGQLEGINKAEVIKAWARGWRTKFQKWLPSAQEQRDLDEAAAKQALAEKEAAAAAKAAAGDEEEGDEGDEEGDQEEGQDEQGEKQAKAAAADDEEEDDFMGGFGGGSDDGSGLF